MSIDKCPGCGARTYICEPECCGAKTICGGIPGCEWTGPPTMPEALIYCVFCDSAVSAADWDSHPCGGGDT